jgi:major membrane immunogen (membrane-anchored lipoprotein)
MMKRISILFLSLLAVAVALPLSAAGKTTKCEMKYTLEGWSAFYKVAHGQGKITCDNGQSADVTLEAKGGGLTAGKYKVRDGLGKFSEVADIAELMGTYAASAAEAGAVKSTTAGAMTKGEVSLALAGKGTGFNLGVSFGKFTIAKK